MGEKNKPLILLTGATGYVGGRLLHVLEKKGCLVRCLARKPEYLQARVSGKTQIVAGDVLDKDSLKRALTGVHTAYYMVHSMGSDTDFEDLDRQAAWNFGEAASECKVQRIVYLGGLGDSSNHLSPHLRSRQEVGRVLRQFGVQVIELRASIVIGSGSLSFEMVRTLVERLPVMVTPRWVGVKAQPIAISDLLAYLVTAFKGEFDGHQIFEIGGTDQVSYGQIMQEYARQRGLRRYMIPVPVLTPHLSSLWLGLVTPLYARIGRKLISSIQHPTVVQDDSASRVFEICPKGVKDAIAEALQNEDKELAETRWTDAVSAAGPQRNWGGVRFGNRLIDAREVSVDTTPEQAFRAIQRIGGSTGWYFANWLWHLRGFLDLLVGGVGMRRGRRHPEKLRVGDVLDFWRVEAFEPHKRLRLQAEMKLPGRAWLEFEVQGNGARATIRQSAVFDPVGLFGLVYWYGIYPLHSLIFAGMIRGVANVAMKDEESDD
ncbi:SDR family oxidoreductase [candidate division KSB1 bacterium]|nr:SDR family oxidoreductase [candidate division KSB1 bacterium]NIR71263.1 SDR family oxidoreductase [candidate division KSB1 bacterium]NIS24792.1 SDR family oxidoreductase [candidate division KSB1 bacterium]NIT71699.1 SDR family oxidoreductase [candidate division KSB1 bacterium]NIU25428.1 SDR family oxidoreductase [candidate division KSB1 bacterium]